ncbi:MAG TPA: dihydropteroate synthase [Burkholderiales bacterium]|nr:dihydropteroate synthase [Burkholderiales bacterium]
MSAILRCGRFRLSLDRPLVMGVVNVTPDSFYDGGRHASNAAAIAHARRLAEEGADLLDIGGESSRPGSEAVSLDEELARVLPVLEGLCDLEIPISVDTTKPAVMRATIAAGAAMINDITALAAPGSIDAVAASDAAVCLMHMRGAPKTMQADPVYADVVAEVREFLGARVAACAAAGIARDRITIDPGFGFGKTVEHNFTLLRELGAIAALGFPVLAGWSRKSSLGRITGRASVERLASSLAAALIAVQHGAKIVRVHDVAATRDVLAILAAAQGKP